VATIAAGELAAVNVPDRIRLLPAMAGAAASQAFDPRAFANNDQARALMHFFVEFGLFAEFRISLGRFLPFIAAFQREYHNIPYHNWCHALEVAQFVFFMIKTAALGGVFSRRSSPQSAATSDTPGAVRAVVQGPADREGAQLLRRSADSRTAAVQHCRRVRRGTAARVLGDRRRMHPRNRPVRLGAGRERRAQTHWRCGTARFDSGREPKRFA
jgi:hypothetical protein